MNDSTANATEPSRKVLVVDDEQDLLDLLSYNFQASGYHVKTATSGGAAIAELDSFSPDVVLLDLMLPDMPGTDVCRRIRNGEGRQPVVIMVSAKGEEIDRVVGFELGANDYVVKPFSTRELILRTNALLRSNRSEAAAAPVPEDARRIKRRILTIGPLTIDADAHRVFVAGEEIHVSALEMRFIADLVKHRGRVRSRDDLLEEVWGYSPAATTRTVDTHVKRLRDKLQAAGSLLETVRGAGYRLSDAYEMIATDR
ncbi:MAG TPA: response regulator transcription factor [Polyangia bacterium]|jgi:two-component system phosphate regulon response regulator PhoB|nr:response regulator transcription factor [Polyangia bacterium]